MSPNNHRHEDLNEFEALLPWYVAGTLDAETMKRMDRALEANPELQHQLELTLEEQQESIRLNEELGMPSSAALGNLMKQIEAEPQKGAMTRSLMRRLSGWMGDFTASLSPAALGASAAAAALVICLQAALIAGLYFKSPPQGAVYETASHGQGQVKPAGPRALIAFQPDVKTSEMADFLSANTLRIVDGPRPGGFYLVGFAATTDAEAVNKQIKTLQANTKLVRFVALSQ